MKNLRIKILGSLGQNGRATFRRALVRGQEADSHDWVGHANACTTRLEERIRGLTSPGSPGEASVHESPEGKIYGHVCRREDEKKRTPEAGRFRTSQRQ